VLGLAGRPIRIGLIESLVILAACLDAPEPHTTNGRTSCPMAERSSTRSQVADLNEHEGGGLAHHRWTGDMAFAG